MKRVIRASYDGWVFDPQVYKKVYKGSTEQISDFAFEDFYQHTLERACQEMFHWIYKEARVKNISLKDIPDYLRSRTFDNRNSGYYQNSRVESYIDTIDDAINSGKWSSTYELADWSRRACKEFDAMRDYYLAKNRSSQ